MSRIRRLLCKRSEIADGAARGIVVVHGSHRRDTVLVSRDGQLHAYVNSCPHQNTPLETFPDRFLNPEGTQLICSMHGARFRVEDGFCVSGPCEGRFLKPADIVVENDDVYLLI